MTNDTTTLSGSLQELGETMASNLVAMGVSGADASDGLTTLAQNILDIAPAVGGITPTVSIDLSKSPTIVCRGANLAINALVNADYDDESVADVDLKGYLQGATITFQNGNADLGYAVTDSDGIATLVVQNVQQGNYSVIANFDGTGTDYESATSSALSFTVTDYPTITLTADKTTVNVGETVTFTVTVEYNNNPIAGYPIQIYKDGSSLGSQYSDITNNSGECSIEYIIPSDASDMVINANALSNNVTITLPLFYDTCNNAEGLSNYGSVYSFEGNSNASMTYDSTMNAYKLQNTGRGTKAYPIPVLQGCTKLKLSAEVYIPSTAYGDTSVGLEVIGTNHTTWGLGVSKNSGFGSLYHIFRDDAWVSNTTVYGSITNNWVEIILEIDNKNISYTLKSNDTVHASGTYDLSSSLDSYYSNVSDRQYGIGIGWSNRSDCYGYIRNIKAEEI